jgi:microcystin-dependent protein
MSNPYLGEIRMFAGNFAPKGWAMCNGQLLSIAQNTALFSLLGTYYGGDGRSTFALPNLQGSTPLGAGQKAGLSQRSLGEVGGAASVTLQSSQIPAHSHSFTPPTSDATADTLTLDSSNASTAYLGVANTPTGRVSPLPYASSGAGASMPLSATGSDGSHNNMPPYLAVNFIIALQGIFPPRS